MTTDHKRRRLMRLLLCSQCLTLAVLFWVLYREHYFQRLLSHFQPDPPARAWSYRDNSDYADFVAFHEQLRQPATVVFLGTSQTARASWTEWLRRCDVANRGVVGDVTEGYLHRLHTVRSVRPSICFVEGGINDVAHDVPVPAILGNLAQLCDSLQAGSIRPVLSTVPHVGSRQRDAETINRQLDQLNEGIRRLGAQQQQPLLDLAAAMNGCDSCLSSDDLHLSAAGYRIWAGMATQVLDSLATAP